MPTPSPNQWTAVFYQGMFRVLFYMSTHSNLKIRNVCTVVLPLLGLTGSLKPFIFYLPAITLFSTLQLIYSTSFPILVFTKEKDMFIHSCKVERIEG
jgi:hypothetical protein